MSGGKTYSTIKQTIEFLGNESLSIKFPSAAVYSPTVLVHKNELIVVAANYCFIFENGSWLFHSCLNKSRRNAIVISMPRGIYVFGGHDSPYTSEFLPNGHKVWQDGPKIPRPGIVWLGGVGAPVSQNELIFVTGCFTDVMKLNIETQEWTKTENLLKGRCHQQYALFNNKLIVCGGYYKENSTEIIDLSNGTIRKGGDLQVGRSMHGMDILKINGRSVVIAFGGLNSHNQYLDSIEEWNDESETWKMSSLKLSEAKAKFRYFSQSSLKMQPVYSDAMIPSGIKKSLDIYNIVGSIIPSFVNEFLGLSLNTSIHQEVDKSANCSTIALLDNFIHKQNWRKSLCSLPIEVIVKIFNVLDYNSLKASRSVCKNWKNIIDEFGLVAKSSQFIVSTHVILSGGISTRQNIVTKTIEVLGTPQLSIPPLQSRRRFHSMVFTNDNDLIVMGNYPMAPDRRQCVAVKRWPIFSSLPSPRVSAIGITMANGIYMFGGRESPRTSDFLPNGKFNWTIGPDIPGMGCQYGHGVAISPTTLVLTGGLDTPHKMIAFNTEIQEWFEIGTLLEGRTDHRCIFYNGKLIVTGGYDGWNELKSTEIHDLSKGTSRAAANLNVARMGHGMGIINLNGYSTLVAFGGENCKIRGKYLDSVEEWNDMEETWTLSTLKLSEGRSDFGYCSGKMSTFQYLCQ